LHRLELRLGWWSVMRLRLGQWLQQVRRECGGQVVQERQRLRTSNSTSSSAVAAGRLRQENGQVGHQWRLRASAALARRCVAALQLFPEPHAPPARPLAANAKETKKDDGHTTRRE
jgi:hypothetical protein